MATKKTHEEKCWRRNVSLRLTKKVGQWMDHVKKTHNRPYANYVELLVIKDMEKHENGIDAEGI